MFFLFENGGKARAKRSANELGTRAPLPTPVITLAKSKRITLCAKPVMRDPKGHPNPSKDEDIFVAEMVSQPSSHEDKDATAKRVCCQEPRHLTIACRVESSTDLLHGKCRVPQTSD